MLNSNSFLEQVDEIHKHQWIESEKAGHDLGEEWAAIDWISKYAKLFRAGLTRKSKTTTTTTITVTVTTTQEKEHVNTTGIY